MKQLYIRFYVNASSQIPYNSYPICYQDARNEVVEALMTQHFEDMKDWMLKNPNGKVDFVWLS